MRAKYTFIVDDTVSGVLRPLSSLIECINLQGIARWQFHEIKLFGRGKPFGLTFEEFEAATWASSTGFEVPDHEFRLFLQSPVQIVDGTVEAWSNQVPASCVVRFDCEDATQWRIITDSSMLANKLERAGFSRAQREK
jgi:hypothetical protein